MEERMEGMKRTHYCGDLRIGDIGKEVTVMGWVHRRRDLGGVIFINLRDVSGHLQVIFRSETEETSFQKAEKLRSEYVIAVRGKVAAREPNTINPKMKTGDIEIEAKELRILSEAKTPPIDMEEHSDTNELVRLKYRYLDLRREDMQRNIRLRSRMYRSARNFYSDSGFHEIETPILTKSTPEGARDYLVPSRISKGSFYALPQSPQIFKQLLMVGGFDRYMQITRCFRDEDLRRDRQPEFTQIDVEMSFVDVEDVLHVSELFLQHLIRDIKGVEIPIPFPRMTYRRAMDTYGTDKPDIRYGMEFQNLTELLGKSSFKVFSDAVAAGGQIKCIRIPEGKTLLSRKDLDSLTEKARQLEAQGLVWCIVEEGGVRSPAAKHLVAEEIQGIINKTGASDGDVLLLVSDRNETVNKVLGGLRIHLGQKLGLIKGAMEFAFLWVTDFPLFEYSNEEKRLVSTHHPFTSPRDDQLHLLEDHPEQVLAKAYDIVWNGNEIGGGSIRIHNREIQNRMFRLLGFDEKTARERFGFFLDALEYGVPPHGGIAFGFDRIAMILTGCDNIRDVIAFPKIQNASCPMTDAPASVDAKQLEELGIIISGLNENGERT